MERLTCYMLGTRTQTGRGSQNLVDNTDVPFYQIPGDKQELSRNRQTPVLYSIESELLPKRERHAVFGKEREHERWAKSADHSVSPFMNS